MDRIGVRASSVERSRGDKSAICSAICSVETDEIA
jgi:hypothetical protein